MRSAGVGPDEAVGASFHDNRLTVLRSMNMRRYWKRLDTWRGVNMGFQIVGFLLFYNE